MTCIHTTTGRAFAVAAIAAFTVVGPAAAAAVRPAAAGALNPQAFTDPTGDSGGGPDISRVTVSNTAAGMIRVDIALPNGGTVLPDSSGIGIFFDADRDESTGYDGFEYTIQTAGSLGEAVVGRWDGTTYAPVSAPSFVKIWTSGGTMTFEIARADLGHTERFWFWVATWTAVDNPPDGWDDVAPDGTAVYDYALTMPAVASATAQFAPAAPRAGARFAVTGATFALVTKEQVRATRLGCRASLGRTRLRGSGAGGCAFVVPRDARHKRLSLTITATVGDVSRTIRKTLTVR